MILVYVEINWCTGTYGSLGCSTGCALGWHGTIEVKDGKLAQRRASEQSLALNQKSLEALDGRRSGKEIAEELCLFFGGSWSGWSS